MRRLRAFLLALTVAAGLCGCGRKPSQDNGKLRVVCTLFPYYDFVRQIGGDDVDVTLVVPAGRETHSFEPTPLDVIRISEAGLWQAAFIACRLLLLLLGMSLLTLTTATLDITDAFEYLLRPFRRIGVPAHELSMMMGIALRFLPQFTFELQTVYRAQISRGATFSKGRLRMLASLMVPLFTSAFRHAETLSAAMDARCYHGGEGRTRLHPLKLSARDGVAAGVLAVLAVCVGLADALL